MDKEYFKNLLKKYKGGECTSEELDEFLVYINNNPNSTLIEYLFEEDSENLYFQDSLIEIPLVSETKPIKNRRVNFLSKRFYVAACLITSLLVGITWYKLSDKTAFYTNRQVSAEINHLLLPSGKVIPLLNQVDTATIVYENDNVQVVQRNPYDIEINELHQEKGEDEFLQLVIAKAKRMKLSFSDGTSVWINAESQLKFPTRFTEEERTVELLGEAYFDVYHAKERPFLVKTPQQLIQVYGTRFNVRNYSDEDKHSVKLYEGKLSVRDIFKDSYSSEVILSPGEQVDLITSAEVFQKIRVTSQEDSSQWITGSKTYEKTLLREIFLDLSHQYDITIDWQNVPSLHFSGRLNENMTLNEIVNILNKTANIKIKNDNNNITF